MLINSDGTIYSKHLGYERGDEIKIEREIEELISYNLKFNSTFEKKEKLEKEEKDTEIDNQNK